MCYIGGMDLPHAAPLATAADALTDGCVALRLPVDGDGAVVFAFGQDADIEETAWLPIPFPCTRADAARIVGEFQRGWQGRFGLTLVITMPPASDLRGVLHLSMHTTGAGEIAYGVAPRCRGRGLATRAVTLMATWALACLEIVVTAPGAYGEASRRVAEKAGFVYAGTRRSRVMATGLDYEDPLYILAAPGAVLDDS